jgi:hypothetical protein
VPTPTTWPLWLPTEAAGAATARGDGDVVSAQKLTIEAVYAPLRTKVLVTFSSPVKMTSGETGALRVSNYRLSNAVIEAVEEVAYREVLLTTSPLYIETPYTLTVDNVEDILGNPISPA